MPRGDNWRRPVGQRFWEKVQKTPECWLWIGGLKSTGYGSFWNGERNVGAHRWAYEALIGPVSDGLQLDHLCRVRNCVNPGHLRAVDNRTNVLAGVGPTAIHARQTHCISGHEFTPENIKWTSSGGRQCRTCARRRTKEWEMRKHLAMDEPLASVAPDTATPGEVPPECLTHAHIPWNNWCTPASSADDKAGEGK